MWLLISTIGQFHKEEFIIMSMVSRAKAFVPAWIVVLGVVALFAWPITLATGAFLLLVAIVPPVILLILSREPSLTVAEVLHHAETSQTK